MNRFLFSLRKSIVLTIFILSVFLLLVSCATNIYPVQQYDPLRHKNAMEEWGPHEQTLEWWYATGILEDESGDMYFYQFTIFHGYRFTTLEGFAIHLAVTNIQTGEHYFYQSLSPPTKRIFAAGDKTVYTDSSVKITVTGEGDLAVMKLTGMAGDFSFDLTARPSKDVVWHGKDGIVVMGHEQKKKERSFYYSYTNMPTAGRLEIGEEKKAVQGTSWFDRQWGRFRELYWEWFSFRFDDGREIMIFRFPDTGYKAGTMVNADGSFRPLDEKRLEIINLKSIQFDKGRHSWDLGWKLNVEGEEYIVQPLMENQANLAHGLPSYWEGLCSLTNADGNNLGWCVVESTSPIF